MRKFVLLGLTILVCNLWASAQWKWLNPKPSGYINSKLRFINSDTGYLFNSNGDLFKTYNGGAQWQLHQNFPNASIMDLADSTGVIAGWNGTLYISTDNGRTWQAKNPGTSDYFKKIDIISRDTIFLINTDNGKIYKSSDRGNTWQLSVTYATGFKTIDFVSSNTGYMAIWNGIYKTTNGGGSWQLLYPVTTSAGVIQVKFHNSQFGYAYRESDDMLRTTDGGATWTASLVPDDIEDIFIINQANAYAVGEHGVVFRTVDGGTTWTWASPGGRIYAHDLYSQHFFNDTTGIVVGHRGRILKTTNGGQTWQQFSPTYIDVTAVSFGSNNVGYATTWNNIYKTTDKGQTWTPLQLSVGTAYADNARFDHCWFYSADTGFVTATNRARIYRTTNGGLGWTIVNVPWQYQPYDYTAGISFINGTTGFATFRTGSFYGIFKTTDGGENWQQIGFNQNYYKLHFVNERTGYATQYRKLFRTTDSAKNWTEVLSSDMGEFESVYFINAAKGFVAGEQGYLKMTLDSGKTWQSVGPADYYDDFIKMKFYDDRIGYLTAESGVIFKTLDGGLTWNKNGASAFYDCPAIAFTKDTNVYIGGMYGSILTSYIPEYRVDSFKVAVTGCAADFSADITAALSSVDSIWFQYGVNDFSNTIKPNPSNVNNTKVRSVANVTGLVQGTAYKARVKVYYKGAYHYSNTVVFNTSMLPKPFVIDSVGILVSTAFTGNQWYLNGQVITGANARTYAATVTGLYAVQYSQNGCLSDMSDGHNFTVGGSVLADSSVVFPNPVKDVVHIKNKGMKMLEITITDVNGRQVYATRSANGLISISLIRFRPGNYVLTIKDVQKNEKVAKNIVKM